MRRPRGIGPVAGCAGARECGSGSSMNSDTRSHKATPTPEKSPGGEQRPAQQSRPDQLTPEKSGKMSKKRAEVSSETAVPREQLLELYYYLRLNRSLEELLV